MTEKTHYLEGDNRVYQIKGTIDFTIRNQHGTLTIYEKEGHLFLPFKDQTSGKESYGAGRYLDIEEADRVVTVDFNQAYSPWCGYNDNYSCPLVPRDNILPFAIEAGEKTFPHDDVGTT